jgi:hypothetical protein
MDEIKIENSGNLTICLNGNLEKTYNTIAEALADARPEQKDVIIVFSGIDNNDIHVGG